MPLLPIVGRPPAPHPTGLVPLETFHVHVEENVQETEILYRRTELPDCGWVGKQSRKVSQMTSDGHAVPESHAGNQCARYGSPLQHLRMFKKGIIRRDLDHISIDDPKTADGDPCRAHQRIVANDLNIVRFQREAQGVVIGRHRFGGRFDPNFSSTGRDEMDGLNNSRQWRLLEIGSVGPCRDCAGKGLPLASTKGEHRQTVVFQLLVECVNGDASFDMKELFGRSAEVPILPARRQDGAASGFIGQEVDAILQLPDVDDPVLGRGAILVGPTTPDGLHLFAMRFSRSKDGNEILARRRLEVSRDDVADSSNPVAPLRIIPALARIRIVIW